MQVSVVISEVVDLMAGGGFVHGPEFAVLH